MRDEDLSEKIEQFIDKSIIWIYFILFFIRQ